MTTPHESSSGEGELRPDVTSTGTDAGPSSSLVFAPEDQPIADAILAMDPMETPSSNKWPAGRRAPTLKLDALNPEMRSEAQAKLAALPPHARERAEERVVAEVVRGHVARNPSIPLGAYALPYHAEQRQIALEYRDKEREFDRLSEELAEVLEYRTENDPQTGIPQPVPVMRVQGARRAGHLDRMAELSREMRLLHDDKTDQPGLEGAKRLRGALAESVQLHKSRADEVAIHAEAKELAKSDARRKRVEHLAAAFESWNGGSNS